MHAEPDLADGYAAEVAAAAGHDQAGPTRRLADPAIRTAADAAMESYHQFVWAAHRFQDQPATCEQGIANS